MRHPSELVAALLVRALRDVTRDGDDLLAEVIGDYRETRAHEVLPTDQTEGMLDLPTR